MGCNVVRRSIQQILGFDRKLFDKIIENAEPHGKERRRLSFGAIQFYPTLSDKY